MADGSDACLEECVEVGIFTGLHALRLILMGLIFYIKYSTVYLQEIITLRPLHFESLLQYWRFLCNQTYLPFKGMC